MIRLRTSLFIFILAFSIGAVAAEPIVLDGQREIFVDDYLIDTMDGVALQLHQPCYAGEAIRFDNPWEGKFAGYITVFNDGEKYRMYYRGMPEAGSDGTNNEVTCYAESDDGITWTKPNLGIFEYDGSRDNNIILADAAPFSHNFAPFHDTNPDAAPEARYKAIAGTRNGNKESGNPGGLHIFASPDGIHWKLMHDEPIITEGAFDSQNVGFWSEHEEQYVCYFRTMSETDTGRLRSVSRATSKDGINWSEPVAMSYGGTPREHLYTNQTQPYFRAPHIYIALPMRFMPGRQVLTPEQAKQLGVHVGDRHSYAGDCADCVFMTTRGGSQYDRTFMEAFIRPGTDLGNWASRAGMAAHGVVQTGPAEMSVYKQFHYAQPSAYLGRYTLRVDGFASIRAPYEQGEWVTKPFVTKGSILELNFATSAAGEVRVEVQSAEGDVLEGFSAAECVPIIGDQLDRSVRWSENEDLSQLAGKSIRLRITMQDADIYALRIR
jgi:hypothetical protein